MKVCSKCNVKRQLSEFRRRTKSKPALHTICRECQNKASNEWHRKNNSRSKELQKNYYNANVKNILKNRSDFYSLSGGKERTRKTQANIRSQLSDGYVRSYIKRVTGIPVDVLKHHPDLVASWREQIKCKRALKSIKNKNNGKEISKTK